MMYFEQLFKIVQVFIEEVNNVIYCLMEFFLGWFKGIVGFLQSFDVLVVEWMKELWCIVIEFGFVGVMLNFDLYEGLQVLFVFGDCYWYLFYEVFVEFDVFVIIYVVGCCLLICEFYLFYFI